MTKEDHEQLMILKQAHETKADEIDKRIENEWSCHTCKWKKGVTGNARSGYWYCCTNPDQTDEILKAEAGNHVYPTGCPLHEKG